MTHDARRRRSDPVHLPFGFAPQIFPALQVAEWLTGRFTGERHRVQRGKTVGGSRARRW